MLVAVTASDETNMVACKHRARACSTCRRSIARIALDRLPVAIRRCLLGADGFAVDLVDLPRAGPDRLHRQAGRVPGGAAGARVRRRQGEPGRGAGVRRRARWWAIRSQGSAPPYPAASTRASSPSSAQRRRRSCRRATRSSRRATKCSSSRPRDDIREVMRELRRMDKPGAARDDRRRRQHRPARSRSRSRSAISVKVIEHNKRALRSCSRRGSTKRWC